MIEFIVQMSGFQQRFHWMLSALVEQANPPAFRLRVDTCVDDPWADRTATLRRLFDGLLDIEWIERTAKAFASRGILRDLAMQQSTADWLLFSDADIIYPPEFMARLDAEYLAPGLHDDSLLATIRHTPGGDEVDAVVEAADYEAPIRGGYAKALALWEANGGMSSEPKGVGYFQLCRRAEALRRGTYYRDKTCRDIPLAGLAGGKTGSDRTFRKGWQVVEVQLRPLMHLRHERAWRGEWKGGLR